jgi:orotate phosphoribosyltransferase
MSPTGASPDRDTLLEILVRRSLRFGQFTLASGLRAPSMSTSGRRASMPRALRVIGRLACDALDPGIRAVGGLTLGADPIVHGGAARSGCTRPTLDAFLVRKAAKEHACRTGSRGTRRRGTRALVVEDVCTSGGSALDAARAARAAGAIVEHAWCVVDRGAGGRESAGRGGHRPDRLPDAR